MRALASAWTWFAIVLLIVVWVPLLAVVHLFDRDPTQYATGRWFRRLGSTMTRVNPLWRIQITGRMPDDPRHPYVVVCNHQSLADIPIISRLSWDMKWLAKQELFEKPLVGTMMRLAGDIPVDRGNRRSGVEALITAAKYLGNRSSVFFFPEGTRSRDGCIEAFSPGAFLAAIRAGVPILPLAIDGTLDALPKHSWKFGRAPLIRLQVFDPVSTEGLDKGDVDMLTAQVRDLIVNQVAAWRGTTAAGVDATKDCNGRPALPEEQVAVAEDGLRS